MPILLSILTPSLPERADLLAELTAVILPQCTDEVEFLVLTDNRRSHSGEKRNHLMDIAKGKYLCHIDDDELVSPNFVASILPHCHTDYDLISYDADASFDGSPPFKVFTSLHNDNEQPSALPEGGFTDIKRKPWHWCTWRTELARKFRFPLVYDRAEDWFWLQQIIPAVGPWVKVDEVLFHHRYNSKRTTFNK